MKSYTLDQAEDLLIEKKGTTEREEYEFELKLELIGNMIKTARKKSNLRKNNWENWWESKKPKYQGLKTTPEILRLKRSCGYSMHWGKNLV
jgi:hypothetical protein